MFSSRGPKESKCQHLMIKLSLIINSSLSMCGTIGVYYGLFFYNGQFGYYPSDMYILFGIIKTFAIVPFLSFEYYLIMFEHLFVDSSHYQSTISSASFFENG